MDIFNKQESKVRSYSNSFPVVFTKAQGSWLETETASVTWIFLPEQVL
ncbi:diaminobutyrate-pyruvate aminotransferase [Vibrio ponticus]|nr:diaminobutyrate-pyruvate aminotransferase [Vibrio ponticus]